MENIEMKDSVDPTIWSMVGLVKNSTIALLMTLLLLLPFTLIPLVDRTKLIEVLNNLEKPSHGVSSRSNTPLLLCEISRNFFNLRKFKQDEIIETFSYQYCSYVILPIRRNKDWLRQMFITYNNDIEQIAPAILTPTLKQKQQIHNFRIIFTFSESSDFFTKVDGVKLSKKLTKWCVQNQIDGMLFKGFFPMKPETTSQIIGIIKATHSQFYIYKKSLLLSISSEAPVFLYPNRFAAELANYFDLLIVEPPKIVEKIFDFSTLAHNFSTLKDLHIWPSKIVVSFQTYGYNISWANTERRLRTMSYSSIYRNLKNTSRVQYSTAGDFEYIVDWTTQSALIFDNVRSVRKKIDKLKRKKYFGAILWSAEADEIDSAVWSHGSLLQTLNHFIRNKTDERFFNIPQSSLGLKFGNYHGFQSLENRSGNHAVPLHIGTKSA